jgi:hypothetical protein
MLTGLRPKQQQPEQQRPMPLQQPKLRRLQQP